jgi:predicted amidohydrolase
MLRVAETGPENGRMMMFDLVLRGGRILDPGTGKDLVADIAFADGKVAALGVEATGSGREERNVSGTIVMPGMIDFHAHVYWGGTALGVDADTLARRCGTTSWLDAGSAGAGNFAGSANMLLSEVRRGSWPICTSLTQGSSRSQGT